MKKTVLGADSVKKYISGFPKDIQKILRTIRKIIKSEVPEAEEKISYGIPTFTLHGNLVHFGGFKDHVSFFPGSSPILKFRKELRKFKTSKGTIQIPFDKPLPVFLIRKIVKFRVAENNSKERDY
jgi:uncharacterized protein YdhG (YjbR/CyaY superfamily)